MLSRRWTNSHRCSWIMVYVSCCNAQLNFIVDTMTCTCIVMLLSTCQLPSCNLFTQHVSYLSWSDTTSELWTPVHSFASEYKSTAIIYFLHFLQVTIIFHTIRLIIYFQQAGEIDILTVTLDQSFLVVLCAGAVSSPTGSITLVSSLRKNLLLHSSHLPLGVSQRMCDLHVSSTFSGAVAGDL